MAKKTRSTSNSDAENSSAQPKKTAPTESKGTARDVYMKLISTDPRWRELKTSGQSITILGARPPTKVADPNINKNFEEESSNEELATSEDDSEVERCPIRNRTECKRHLLACFGDGVDFVVGLEDGAILDVNELEAVMKLARLVWVQSVRSTGKPLAPRWMEKVPGLDSYFAKLGSGHFDIAKYENDEDAADDLDAETNIYDSREFLWDLLSACGWLGDQTEREFDAPLMSTMYTSWWSARPKTIIKTLRRTLKAALLEAGLKVRSMNKEEREKQKGAGLREAFARYLKEAKVVEPSTTAADNASAKKSVKSPGDQRSPGDQSGQGVPQDDAEVLRAANQGSVDAQWSLGLEYENGGTRNYAGAAKWYRKAAEQGHVLAQHNLGALYDHGLGVRENAAEALKWYRKAADQGNSQSMFAIGNIYANGYGVPQDRSEAVSWFRKAAEKGDADAARWLRNAAAKGDTDD